jgi:uncharacterized glyoxalase superfamily protein PhnB
MSNLKNPYGNQTVIPYLIIPRASEFLQFAKDVFGAIETLKSLREGTNEIMHAEIKIGESTIMFGQSSENWQAHPGSLYTIVEDADAIYNKAISKGAKSVLPMANKEYGRSGGVQDPFGNVWWITTPVS